MLLRSMARMIAILLVGPTGSGKTPLGELLERRGLAGRRCVHFDFGQSLRRVAAGRASAGLAEDELAVVEASLETGALLGDEHFGIADEVLQAFLAERQAGGDDLIVLNGLPRHVGQAEAIEGMLSVQLVVNLRCAAETVLERIASDSGGDRAGRLDDDVESVRRRLAAFEERTAPLLAHYACRGARVETVDVGPTTSAEDVWRQLGSLGMPHMGKG